MQNFKGNTSKKKVEELTSLWPSYEDVITFSVCKFFEENTLKEKVETLRNTGSHYGYAKFFDFKNFLKETRRSKKLRCHYFFRQSMGISLCLIVHFPTMVNI